VSVAGTLNSLTIPMNFVRRLWIDDRGQDLVEYVLLGSTVALAGVAAMQAFPGIASAVYASWDAAQQNLWYPQPPAS
jgi:hypothetical protein